MLIAAGMVCAALALGSSFYLQQPKFGALPEGERLAKVQNSPHYVNGQFENLLPTPQLVGNQSVFSASWNYIFKEKERPAPVDPVPTQKTDLLHMDRDKDVVVWLGHSSYFIQMQGVTFLIDPVFSDAAAPIPFVNQAFAGTNLYKAEDLPEIDYLLISHDHWDHLDYPTIAALQPKIKNVICGLGVGAYFVRWGFLESQIQEADWFTEISLREGLTAHVLPARHYSGRLLEKNKTLWAGFALVGPQQRIFFSGDSGYGPHFKEIGKQLGAFDLVLLDQGQYDPSWPYIHMTPEEAVQAALDLKAKALLPAHVGKFSIANHPWDEPFQRIAQASKDKAYRLLTPKIGEEVELQDQQRSFAHWWESAR